MYNGILYVASNEIIQEAIISARQIRNQMDNPNITIITDELKSENDCFDKVIVEENFHRTGVSNQKKSQTLLMTVLYT